MTEQQKDHGYTPLPQPVRITEQHWPDGTVPLVTIRCTTYNHVNFIRDAIEGFLIQETTFPVEILIHDDASNDGTADIVREYEAKYPQLIKPIYQTENQYSQGNGPGQFMQPLIRGEYIAVCEGDDYWTDAKKLQIQVGWLEENELYAMSFNATKMIQSENGKVLSVMGEKYGSLPRVVRIDEAVNAGLASIATCSIVYRRKAIHESTRFKKFFEKNRTSFFTKFIGSMEGAFYFPETMSTYRASVPGSHTVRVERDRRLKTKYLHLVNDGFIELFPYLNEVQRGLAKRLIINRLHSFMLDRSCNLKDKQNAYIEYAKYSSLTNELYFMLRIPKFLLKQIFYKDQQIKRH